MATNSNTGFLKPGEEKDFSHDWSDEMSYYSDEIDGSDWDADEGITVVNPDTFDATSATVWLTGDTAGEYKVRNTIHTTGGRTRIVEKTIIVSAK